MSYRDKQLQAIHALEQAASSGAAASISTIVPMMDDYASDNRLCLTAVAFVPDDVADIIERDLIAPLRRIEPEHYYYPAASLHVTLQNLRTINEPRSYDDAHIALAREVFQRVVARHSAFELEVEGLLRMPTSLSVTAFSDESLGELALDLRAELAAAGIPDDKIYSSGDVVFANITVCRYANRPAGTFTGVLQNAAVHGFSTMRVDQVDLIETNAVCHPDKTKLLASFKLKA